MSIAIGFIGALLGVWLQRLTGAPELLVLVFDATRFPVVWSLIGAVLFVAVVGFFTSRRPRRY
ncbi:MAG TPA: GlsB/YeaQ/YmgE family stress response membrane protein [Fimbriiglobus sp.]|nr:GlsB/YeaQ/YmgE family stress response membrane protein [Fimbriiglobus sp.]